MNLLKETIEKISASDKAMYKKAKEEWDKLAHPPGSLGRLETLTSRIIAMTGDLNYRTDKKAWVVMSSDNGITEEGVSVIPQSVTCQLVRNMLSGITCAATLAKNSNIDMFIVDIGLVEDIADDKLINRKIQYGTKNFSKGSAMTREDAIKSIEAGIEIGDDLFNKGYKIIATGELGIGNTSTSAAVLSALYNLDVDVTSGKGSGISQEMYDNKKRAIKVGLEVNKPDSNDPIDIIAKVGGFDIGGMTGLYLSAAKNKIPVVIDGFISAVAANLAMAFTKDAVDYMIPSHKSKELGAIIAMEKLGLDPVVDLEMRLGEGTGCPFVMDIIDKAFYVLWNMGRFEKARIDDSELVDLRKE